MRKNNRSAEVVIQPYSDKKALIFLILTLLILTWNSFAASSESTSSSTSSCGLGGTVTNGVCTYVWSQCAIAAQQQQGCNKTYLISAEPKLVNIKGSDWNLNEGTYYLWYSGDNPNDVGNYFIKISDGRKVPCTSNITKADLCESGKSLESMQCYLMENMDDSIQWVQQVQTSQKNSML